MTLKVLYLIETLGHGGAEHQLVATLQVLDRARFEPIVCHFRAPDYLAPSLAKAGIRVVSLAAPPGKRSWPTLVMRLRALVRELGIDLIHTSLLEADVTGGLAGRLAGVPVVSTLCNIAGDPIRLRDNPRNSRLKFAATNLVWGSSLRRLHRHSIAISNAVRDSAVTTFGMRPDRISVIYRGIVPPPTTLDADATNLRRELGAEGASPLLLSVGRLAPQKGHKYLLAALPELIRHFPQAKLALVGEGWLRPTLEAQAAALGIADHVMFLGKRSDVAKLFAACDVFVFPSLFEGLGVSLLEACHAGCACISTDTGPIPEIIQHGENGLLVRPADSETLSRALLQLARDPELRRRLGQSARQRALQKFMLVDKVNEVEALYSRLLPAR